MTKQSVFDFISDRYGAEFAAKLGEKQLFAVYYRILDKEERERHYSKQQFYKSTQLSLFTD